MDNEDELPTPEQVTRLLNDLKEETTSIINAIVAHLKFVVQFCFIIQTQISVKRMILDNPFIQELMNEKKLNAING